MCQPLCAARLPSSRRFPASSTLDAQAGGVWHVRPGDVLVGGHASEAKHADAQRAQHRDQVPAARVAGYLGQARHLERQPQEVLRNRRPGFAGFGRHRYRDRPGLRRSRPELRALGHPGSQREDQRRTQCRSRSHTHGGAGTLSRACRWCIAAPHQRSSKHVSGRARAGHVRFRAAQGARRRRRPSRRQVSADAPASTMRCGLRRPPSRC